MHLITIDSVEFSVPDKVSIIEACEHVGLMVPRFCYHETLSVSGNCRMCVVEIDGIDKPVASCVTEVRADMDILTNSPFVKKARENVVELLLVNHPLDCPICDQAGECDLQDQTKAYASSFSRFFEVKRTSEDKLCNPFIQTIMTRCITCTRCVRFASEVAGVEYFGTLNRGTQTEIGSYTSNPFISEISANVVDLCPVGALNSAPYAYHGRPWELRTSESIDISNSLGANIYVNHRENRIYRILPKATPEINISFISDVTRFSFEHTQKNRVLRIQKKTVEVPYEVSALLDCSRTIEKLHNVNVIVNESIDVKSLFYINNIKKSRKINVLLASKSLARSGNFLVNKQYSIKNLFDKVSNYFFFLGVNLRTENAMLNSRVRFYFRTKGFNIITSGYNFQNNSDSIMLSLNISNLLRFFEGTYKKLSYNLLKNENFLFFVGESFFQRFQSYETFQDNINQILKKHFIVNLYNFANTELTKMFNFKRLNHSVVNGNNLYINLEDTISLRKIHNQVSSRFNVWVNPNMSELANKMEYIFPSASHYEQQLDFVSLGYRFQHSEKSLELSSSVGKNIHILQKLIKNRVNLRSFSYIEKTLLEDVDSKENVYEINHFSFNTSSLTIYSKYPMKQFIRNYYDSAISVYSKSLIQASKMFDTNYSNF